MSSRAKIRVRLVPWTRSQGHLLGLSIPSKCKLQEPRRLVGSRESKDCNSCRLCSPEAVAGAKRRWTPSGGSVHSTLSPFLLQSVPKEKIGPKCLPQSLATFLPIL